MSTEPTISPELESTRCWYPVPGFAIPVTVSLDAFSDLDPMTHAILELCREKPRAEHTLLDLFEGFDKDIITSALSRLLDLGALEYNPEDNLFEANEETMARGIAEEIEHGWVYCYMVPRENRFYALPTLWLGERAQPYLQPERFDQMRAHAPTHAGWRAENKLPDWDQVRRMLGDFLRLDDIAVGRDMRGEGPEHATSSNRVLFAEYERRSEHRVTFVTVWIAVDFIPRDRGEATTVYREPTMVPSQDLPLLVSDRVRDWLEHDKELEAIHQEIRERASTHSREWSGLLRDAGISDEVEFERLRDEHEALLRRRFGLDEISPPPRDPDFARVLETLREVLRWRTLAHEQPESTLFCAPLANSISHGIERLCKSLSDHAKPHLERWRTETWEQFVQIPNEKSPWKAFKEQRREINWYNDRAGDVRLHAYFHKSREFICNTLGSLGKSNPFNFETSGAGMNLTHWLLPAFLLDVDEAQTYAAPIASACGHFVGLNADLLELIDARNGTFHSREDRPTRFEELDLLSDKLFRCVHTLVAAYNEPR
jgi:hypothetical protein